MSDGALIALVLVSGVLIAAACFAEFVEWLHRRRRRR